LFPNIPELKLHLQTSIDVILTNRAVLDQVLLNLVTNAIKYNDKEQGAVRIYYKEHNQLCEFFIEDDGVGIAEKYHKRIFVIFQTLNDRDSFESTGVGLAIVKKILDSKNQEIKLLSEPGKGSVFSFTWPKY
ncbi:MAG: ATP-binding protein, partial [Ferruginibacter sp.]